MSDMTTPRKAKKVSFVKALNQALDLAMERYDECFLIGESIGEMGGDFAVTKDLWTKYGNDRVRDTPLSEAAIIGTCVGSAMVALSSAPRPPMFGASFTTTARRVRFTELSTVSAS